MKKQNYRKIWEEFHGPIPKDSNGRSYEIHHVNGDHNDDRLENLKLVTIEEHYNIHFLQGDYAACHLIAKRMAQDPKELSKIISQLNKLRTGKANPFYGKTHSEETKKIISEKMSGENNPFYGKKRPEHGEKVSKALKGKPKTEEHKKALSESKKGKAYKKFSWKVSYNGVEFTIVNLKKFCRDHALEYKKFYYGVDCAGYKLIGRA